MRLMMVGHEYPPTTGGAGAALQMLASRLVNRGHTVRVLTVGSPGTMDEDGIEVQRVAPLHASGLGRWVSLLTRGAGAARRAVHTFKPDLVNAHFVIPAGWQAGRLLRGRLPLVISAVGADVHDPTRRISPDRSALLHRLTRRAVARADAITTPSTDLTRRLLAMTPDADVHTIPWGFVPAPTAPEPMPIPHDRFVIATVGRLVQRKRIDVLLQAIAKLNDPRVLVLIVGDGPKRDELARQSKAIGLNEQVRFLGRVSDEEKNQVLHRADLFCLPSEHEGFGIALLEAMALSCPVVTTDVGGQSDFIREGVEGCLVPVGIVEPLQEAIASLISEPHQLAEMSRSAIAMSERFTAEQTAIAFERLFEQVIQRR